MEFHAAANEFPMLDEKRLRELANDIEKNGQRESIKTFDGKILDGRNRYMACQLIGRSPKYQPLSESVDPWAYVWSLNGERRDITTDQRYLIWKSCHEKSDGFQAELRRIQDEANAKRAEKARERERTETETGKTVFASQEVPQLVEPLESNPKPQIETKATIQTKPKPTNEAKAEASKTNRGSVERMDRLTNKRPDLADKVKVGELKSAEAMRQMKKDEVAGKVAELPPDKYRVIYADPPWSYNDGRTGDTMTATGALHHYPTMPLHEIKALAIPKLAADDSVLFLWATSPLLPEAFEVVKAWGFKYKACFVWDKIRHNMGHYNSVRHEFLLIATKGSCTPENVKLFDSVQSIEKTDKHSEKPEEFRTIIDTIYPNGKRIELFSRKKTENWEAWGNEIE